MYKIRSGNGYVLEVKDAGSVLMTSDKSESMKFSEVEARQIKTQMEMNGLEAVLEKA